MAALMKDLPLQKLPGYGRLVSKEEAAVLEFSLESVTVGNLLRHGRQRLEGKIDGSTMTSLLAACSGRDSSPVICKPPPKCCSASMSLTPLPDSRVTSLPRLLGFLIQDLNYKLVRDAKSTELYPSLILSLHYVCLGLVLSVLRFVSPFLTTYLSALYLDMCHGTS